MNKNKLFILILFVLQIFGANIQTDAQLSEEGIPFSYSQSQEVGKFIPIVVMPLFDKNALLEEDRKDEQSGDKPYRFGNPFFVNYGFNNSGVWQTLRNGSKIWRLGVKSYGAISINLIFDKFFMPPGAKMYVYNKDKSMLIGAFSELNNISEKVFSTAPVSGEEIILEYNEPANVSILAELNISVIVHAYKSIAGFKDPSLDGFGDSQPCEINVICTGGNITQKKRSVALILHQNYTCSGSLINNVRNNGCPYFLTAYHCSCGDVSGPLTWIFMFNYESSQCSPSLNGPTNFTLSGSRIVAQNPATDFLLVSLNNSPPSAYNVYFNGWNRDLDNSSNGFCIHHPVGDVKKISFSDNITTWAQPLNFSACQPTALAFSHYKASFTGYLGIVEPGSSGSPLFSIIAGDALLIGQLHGGSNPCNIASQAYYGRLAVSWNGSGSPQDRLKDWLDPDQTGVGTWPGLDAVSLPIGKKFWIGTNTFKFWGQPSNWCVYGIPQNGDKVEIGVIPTCFIDVNTNSIDSLIISANCAINFSGNYILKCKSFRNLGNGIEMSSSPNGTLEITGGPSGGISSQNIPLTFPQLKISGDAKVSASTNITVNNKLDLNQGTLSILANTITLKGEIIQSNGKIFSDNINGKVEIKDGTIYTGNIIIPGDEYQNLEIDRNSSMELGRDITVQRELKLTNGKIKLGSKNLTLIGNAMITDASSDNFIITDGDGELRIVPANLSTKTSTLKDNSLSQTLLPIGPDENSYNPITIGSSLEVNVSVKHQNFFNENIGINDLWHISGVGNSTLKFEWGPSDIGNEFNDVNTGPVFLVKGTTVKRASSSRSNEATFDNVSISQSETKCVVGKIAKISGPPALTIPPPPQIPPDTKYSTPDMTGFGVFYSWEIENFGGGDAYISGSNKDFTVAVNPGTMMGYFKLWLTITYPTSKDVGGNDFVIGKRVDVGISPVELASFTSTINQRDVTLNWSTTMEENNSGFEIERSNVKNETVKEWKMISFVSGYGNTNEPKDYTFDDKKLNSGIYKYRLKQLDYNGNFEYFELTNEVVIGTPDKFSLSQNYPNPFNPSTKIDFDLPNDGNVRLILFDNLGREVKTILNEFRQAGYYTEGFDASGFPSGVYFYRIENGKNIATKKMLLLK